MTWQFLDPLSNEICWIQSPFCIIYDTMSTFRGASITPSAYGIAYRAIAGPSRLPLLISSRSFADSVQNSSPDPETVEPSASASTSHSNALSASRKTSKKSKKAKEERIWLTRRERAAARPPTRLQSNPLSRDVLARLVSLHHASASFMHRPSEIMTGFDNAFKNIEAEPYFMPYRRWKKGVVSHIAEGSTIKERPIKEDLPPLGKELEDRETLEPSYLYWKTFKPIDSSWTQNKREIKGLAKSEREKQVKEALFGIWDRGGTGMEAVQPSLDGMEEWLKAKGVGIEEFAAEWRDRHKTGVPAE